MTREKSSRLSALVSDFFERHVPIERGLSPNTLLSYRDAMVLFLGHAARRRKCSPDELQLDHLDAATVCSFLEWLERARHAKASTCNQRLGALKAFFRFVANIAPDNLDRCRQIREIAGRRVPHREPRYLDEGEVAGMLAAARGSRAPARDEALLAVLYNTGARVQELVDLDLRHLVLDAPPRLTITGKGQKTRTCPLWTSTVRVLKAWLRERSDGQADRPLFTNARGQRLTRSGVSYVIKRLAGSAALRRNGRMLHVSPHVLRHTTAMHMLRSGVDLIVISAWLGHADISTTHAYVEVDMRMKQAAVAATALPGGAPRRRARHPGPALIRRLKALARGPNYAERSRLSAAWKAGQGERLHITEDST